MPEFYKHSLLKAWEEMHLSGFQNEIWFSCPVPTPSVKVQTNFLLSYLVIVLYYLCHQPFLCSRLALSDACRVFSY